MRGVADTIQKTATCTLCNKELRYESGGLRAIRNHALSAEHVTRAKMRDEGIHRNVSEAFVPRQQSAISCCN